MEEDLVFVSNLKEFPCMSMGVLAPGSAHVRPSAQPPLDVSGNFLAPVSAESPSKIRDQSFPEEVSLKKDR